jgi:hypothetical protein
MRLLTWMLIIFFFFIWLVSLVIIRSSYLDILIKVMLNSWVSLNKLRLILILSFDVLQRMTFWDVL